ncbi:unnamed protein product [Linum tenue]|uniref:Calcineurin B-like protein n=1 Tax=Linum tenue TaxID=586396 RepID=A0AAV0M884_9ROSI|nr:unnamed protein product [Linum tenue]
MPLVKGKSFLLQMKSCCCASHKLIREKEKALLASQTHFTEDEVEALFELFRKLSSSLVDDGVISKEEFQLGLFGNSRKQTLLANRLFQLFDSKRDGAIDFEEFVRALSVFHPKAAQTEKAACKKPTSFFCILLISSSCLFILMAQLIHDDLPVSFQLYDIWETGFIQRKEVKELFLALLDESDLLLTDETVEAIVDKTFNEADSKGDGKIDEEEWRHFTAQYPSLLQSVTLPHLLDVGTVYPSFTSV